MPVDDETVLMSVVVAGQAFKRSNGNTCIRTEGAVTASGNAVNAIITNSNGIMVNVPATELVTVYPNAKINLGAGA